MFPLQGSRARGVASRKMGYIPSHPNMMLTPSWRLWVRMVLNWILYPSSTYNLSWMWSCFNNAFHICWTPQMLYMALQSSTLTRASDIRPDHANQVEDHLPPEYTILSMGTKGNIFTKASSSLGTKPNSASILYKNLK
jgi:hypothetical protein